MQEIKVGSILAVASLVIVGAILACGPSSGSQSGNGCVSAFNALCERACTCGSGQCRLVKVDDAGASADLTFSTLNDCELLYSLDCYGDGGLPSNFDSAACTAAASSASCVQSSEGPGAAIPAVCSQG